MQFSVRVHQTDRAQLFPSASASPLVITDTFLLMSLLPAAQCFFKFLGNYLTTDNATTLEKRATKSIEDELHEILRNSVIPLSHRAPQDWQPLLDSRMLRSTSLQNFSVSHFNFFPQGPSPEPAEDNYFSGKDLIDNHQQTISLMEDSLKLYENDVSYLENNIQALRNKTQESDQVIHELERNASRLNKLLERKESELADANRKVHNYHKYYCWSLIQIANLMKEENTLRDENINLLLLMEECCSDREYCEDKLREYQEKLNQIEKEMCEVTADMQRRKKQFQEEKSKSREEISQLSGENERLRVECEVHQSEVKKCEQMMELYKKRMDQVKHLVEAKNCEISNLEKRLTQLETKLCEVQKDKINTLNDLQSERIKNEELTTLKRTLNEKISSLECLLKESNAQTSTFCQTVKSLEDESSQLQDENSQLKLSLNSLKDELSTIKVYYEKKLKHKSAEIEKVKEEAARNECELRDQLALTREKLEDCKSNEEAMRTELEMVKTEGKCRNELSKVMEDQHHRLNMSYEALYKEFSVTMDELNKRTEEFSQLQNAMTKMTEHNKMLKEVEANFKIREQTMEQEVKEKLTSYEREILEKSEKLTELEELTSKYVAQMETFRQDIRERNEQIVQLNERIKNATENHQITNNDDNHAEKESASMVNAQEILSLLEINSAHCKRYRALEKAYKDLSLECSALQQNLSISPSVSNCHGLAEQCSVHVSHIRKLTEENRYLITTLADYKRINGLLLDQIKVSVDHPALELSLPPQSIMNTRYDTPEKDTSSTLSVEDRNTVDLWWENELSIPPTIAYDSTPRTVIYSHASTETKSL